MPKLLLFDGNPAVVEGYRSAFKDVPEVEVKHEYLQNIDADFYVSPANSFGFMDGGIDMVYEQIFPGIEAVVRKRIAFGGEVLVGSCIWVRIPFQGSKQLIVAPTMRTPDTYIANTINVYLAAKAIFSVFKIDKNLVIAMPGLGTATGRVPPMLAGKQVRAAYEECVNRDTPLIFDSWIDAVKYEEWLKEVPA